MGGEEVEEAERVIPMVGDDLLPALVGSAGIVKLPAKVAGGDNRRGLVVDFELAVAAGVKVQDLAQRDRAGS
jgi:hypothetical protein